MSNTIFVTEREFKIHYPNENLDASNEAVVNNGNLNQFINLSISHNESSKKHSSYKYTKILLSYSDAYTFGKWLVDTCEKYLSIKNFANDSANDLAKNSTDSSNN